MSVSLFDWLPSRRIERVEAANRARAAIRRYGDQAEAMLARQLEDPRRIHSRRIIRRALAEVRRLQGKFEKPRVGML